MGGGNRVVIIGAGPGGAACAALLSHEGFDVTVLERNSFAGGKTATFQSNEFSYDMGVHVSTRGEKGPHGEVARRVVADLAFVCSDPFMRIIMGDREHLLPLNFKKLTSLYDLARSIGVKARAFPDLYRMIRGIFSMRSIEKASRFDNISLKDYISRYTADRQIHLFFNLFSCFFLVIPYEKASAGEFIYCFSNAVGDASWGYPKGGFKEICGSFLRSAERDGATVRLGEPAEKILIRDGRACGVKTGKGVYEADIVISSAALRKTVDLAGKENFPAEYVKKIFSMEDSFTGITVKYALKEKFINDGFVLYTPGFEQSYACLESLARGACPEEVALFIPVPSNLDPDLAPEGKQLVIAGTMGPPQLSMSDAAARELDLVERTFLRLFPGIEEKIEWSLRTDLNSVNSLCGRDSADVVGTAQTYTQCGRMRPSSELPVAGLFQTGSDAGGRGVGTELAVDSALRLADHLSGRRSAKK